MRIKIYRKNKKGQELLTHDLLFDRVTKIEIEANE